jgi:nucleotide-binding universal stress UspA family protein
MKGDRDGLRVTPRAQAGLDGGSSGLYGAADRKEGSMFDHIVVLTDLNETTRLTFKLVASVAQTFSAKVTIFHAFRGSSELFYLDGDAAKVRDVIDQADRARVMPKLQSFQEELQAHGVEAAIEARVGSTFDLAVDALSALRADLAVVATSGQHEFTGRVLGSATARIIRDTRIPVLSVNERFAETVEQWSGFRRIVHPIDFAGDFKSVLRAAEDFSVEVGGRLEVVDVVQPLHQQTLTTPEGEILLPKDLQYQIRTKLQARLSDVAHGVTRVPAAWMLIEDNKPGSAVMAYADRGADLIVVPSIGRDQVRNMVLGSTTEHVIKHARCPVLTVHPEWGMAAA